MRLLTWELERMTLDAEQTHSQNSQVIDEFCRNGGQVGGNFEGAPVLLLHTVGAKSGAERINPMMYQQVGDAYAVFACAAGDDTTQPGTTPSWPTRTSPLKSGPRPSRSTPGYLTTPSGHQSGSARNPTIRASPATKPRPTASSRSSSSNHRPHEAAARPRTQARLPLRATCSRR